MFHTIKNVTMTGSKIVIVGELLWCKRTKTLRDVLLEEHHLLQGEIGNPLHYCTIKDTDIIYYLR